MSIGMGGGHPTVGMEGHVLKMQDDDGNEQWRWYAMVSDCPKQSAHTTLNNTITLCSDLQSIGKLPRDTEAVLTTYSDGCGSQYKGTDSLWCSMMASYLFCIVIESVITASGHGKNLVDAMAGFDKAMLKMNLLHTYSSATRDSEGRIISQAEIAIKTLERAFEMMLGNEDTKHKHHDGDNRFTERKYFLSNYCFAHPIPVKDCSFMVRDEDWGPGVKNKISEMFLRYFHYEMPGLVALKRAPCDCKPCYNQLMLPWDHSKEYHEQPKFKILPSCKLEASMKGLNKWVFVKPVLKKESNLCKSQVNKILQMILDVHTDIEREKIKLDHYGAISAPDEPDEIWLVQWKGKPFQLTEDRTVEGSGDVLVKKGAWCCEGHFLHRISHAPGWYEYRFPQPTRHVFWLQQCLDGGVNLEAYNKDTNRPPNGANGDYKVQSAPLLVKLVPKDVRDRFKVMQKRRSQWDLHMMDEEWAAELEQAKKKRKKKIDLTGILSEDEYGVEDEETDEEEEEEEDIKEVAPQAKAPTRAKAPAKAKAPTKAKAPAAKAKKQTKKTKPAKKRAKPAKKRKEEESSDEDYSE